MYENGASWDFETTTTMMTFYYNYCRISIILKFHKICHFQKQWKSLSYFKNFDDFVMFFLWKSWKYLTFFRINWFVNTKKKHAKMESVPIWPKSVRSVRALVLKLIVFGGGVKMADLVTLSRPHFCWKRLVFHVKTEQTINISLDVRLFWQKSCWNHYKYWLKWNLSKILKITQVL